MRMMHVNNIVWILFCLAVFSSKGFAEENLARLSSCSLERYQVAGNSARFS